MAGYVDGFVVPVPTKNVAAYRRMAQQASKIFLEHGAIEFRECVAEDLNVKMGLPFPKAIKLQAGETVMFSWVVYKSCAQRDRANAKIEKDPRTAKMMPKTMPFDFNRMVYGGFKFLVDKRRRSRATSA
jgi:alkaline phosphatase